MAGTCSRLISAFLLILVCALLRGQDTAERQWVPAPNLAEIPSYYAPYEREWPPILPILPQRKRLFSDNSALGRMVQVAGIIFSGHVTSIGRTTVSFGSNPSATTVTFKVEQAMRGTAAGQNLTIREWAGLWSGGERYRVGEHVLLFLYSPSKLGLTSPVARTIGRFAMNSHGMIVMTPQHIATLRTNPILGGKHVVPYVDFARAVERARGEE